MSKYIARKKLTVLFVVAKTIFYRIRLRPFVNRISRVVSMLTGNYVCVSTFSKLLGSCVPNRMPAHVRELDYFHFLCHAQLLR